MAEVCDTGRERNKLSLMGFHEIRLKCETFSKGETPKLNPFSTTDHSHSSSKCD